MFREKIAVLENKRIAPGHYVLRLASAKIAKVAKPGQFVQILCSSATDPLLPRPFSFLTSTNKDFSVLFHVIGKGTKLLSQVQKGDTLWVTGPLGNGFLQGVRDKGKGINYLLVGGGVGIPPLYHLARELVKRKIPKDNIHVFLGARDKILLLCEKDFKMLGVKLHLATDNGSKGKKGFVTELLEDYLHRTSSEINRTPSGREALERTVDKRPANTSLADGVRIYTCGPTPMLKTVSAISQKYDVPCEVSVEEPMACGFGACIGCAIKVKDKTGTGHRFAIACTEGPVFEAGQIVWD